VVHSKSAPKPLRDSGKEKNSVTLNNFSSVADSNPGSSAFLTPGSGIRNRIFGIPDPGPRIPDLGSQTHIFESLVTIFVYKIL
jgi:hypothetical protein